MIKNIEFLLSRVGEQLEMLGKQGFDHIAEKV